MARKPRHTRGKGNRGKQITARLDDPALEAALEKWFQHQRVRPTDSAVVLTALREFLVREGYLER